MGAFSGSKNAVTGEAVTEFQKGEGRGYFTCGNCIHMQGNGCAHPVMMKESKQPKIKGGLIKVAPKDSCKFIRRPGD